MLHNHSRHSADPRFDQRREDRLFPFERALISLGCGFLGYLMGAALIFFVKLLTG